MLCYFLETVLHFEMPTVLVQKTVGKLSKQTAHIKYLSINNSFELEFSGPNITTLYPHHHHVWLSQYNIDSIEFCIISSMLLVGS